MSEGSRHGEVNLGARGWYVIIHPTELIAYPFNLRSSDPVIQTKRKQTHRKRDGNPAKKQKLASTADRYLSHNEGKGN